MSSWKLGSEDKSVSGREFKGRMKRESPLAPP